MKFCKSVCRIIIGLFVAISVLTAIIVGVEQYKPINGQSDAFGLKQEHTTESVIATSRVPSPPEKEPETIAESVKVNGPPVELELLKKVNPDLVGWIDIPDTQIDYPVVQSTDNDKYLHTGFDGNENLSGSIFMDYECQPDFKGRNTILYGHNMHNGTMFKDILKFKDIDYLKEHQYFDIYTFSETIHLKIIGCYYDKANAMIRQTNFETDDEFQKFVRKVLEPCELVGDLEIPVGRLYTLVTCSYEENDARTYLFAIEASE